MEILPWDRQCASVSVSSESGEHSMSLRISGAQAKLNGAPSCMCGVVVVGLDGLDGSEGRKRRSKVLFCMHVYLATALRKLMTRGMLIEYTSASGFQWDMRWLTRCTAHSCAIGIEAGSVGCSIMPYEREIAL